MKSSFNLWIANHYAGNLELGMEYRHFFLARHLRKSGHRVSIISASYHHLYNTPPELDDTVTFGKSDDVQFAWLRTPAYQGNGPGRLWNMLTFLGRLVRHRKRLEKHLGRPDAVLGSSPHPFITLNLLHFRRVYGIPILFEVRDLWPQMLIELGSIPRWHPLSYLFRWLEGLGYKKADRVISLWHSADEYMIQHGLDEARYLYLPNGVEVSADTDAEATRDHVLLERVRERKASGKFLVGYGGSHGLANPLACIIDCCELLRDRGITDVEFFLVGDGPEKTGIIERAERAGLNNIHFHGYVSRSVILEFYRELDVAYMGLRDLPLFRFGPTPNKLMDYLVTGSPIIFGIRSSYNPVNEAGAGITIEPDEPDQLLHAIETMRAKNVEERDRMGRAGRAYALRHLEFGELARKLEGAVKECLQAQ